MTVISPHRPEAATVPTMGQLNINHIKVALKRRFETLIDMSDLSPKMPAHDRESTLLTRSLAAFVITELAGADDKVAAKAVVDDGDDNGIDAFHFQSTEGVCYVVQSKWSHEGKGSVALSDIARFAQGVRDLLQPRMDRFGKLRQKQAEIEHALGEPSVTFVLVLAYTGEHELADQARRPIDDLLEEENSVDELITFRPLRQADIYAMVAQKALGDKSVKLRIMLREWGRITEPYVAYYGQVDLEEIAGWKVHGQNLYVRNLRGFKGSTDVNEGIVHTAKYAPDNFWYFNNGITILCDRLSKLIQGGSNRDSGLFECEGASVVNGAQTVGSIISALESGPNGFDRARVLVRLISLDKCPPSFASDVTRAANTQNRIEKKDFAAQDEQQARLQIELLLECGKTYSYKTGDRIPAPDDGCTLDDAAVALACAHQDVDLCTQAKREVGKLYDDITKPPYTILFNPTVSPLRLWRAVLVLRSVDETLKREQLTLQQRNRLIAVHGNRFMLHAVFRTLGKFDEPTTDFGPVLRTIPDKTRDILDRTIHVADKKFPSNYAANIFKSPARCKELEVSL
jgi:hypothetical protein